jgi:pyruvate dehydrogenase E2 component (dihydrolipoamide acetyltransferase)
MKQFPQKPTVLSSEKFGWQRKIVSNMTTESWDNIPHFSTLYEPDATALLAEYQRLKQLPAWKGISLNTLMLYIITQGLLACPAMNAHLTFQRSLIYGKIKRFAEVNITMPMGLPDGTMMPVNMRNCESKGLRALQDQINDVRRRMAQTSLDDALYEVVIADTIQKLQRLRVLKVLGRLVGAKIGAGPINRCKGAVKRAYKALPFTEKLTKADLKQGTVMVSNVGSVYRNGAYFATQMLEIIPPQVAAIAIAGVCEKPGVVALPDGGKAVEPRKYMPICLAGDHRALDFGDIVPFLKRLDELFAGPERMAGWL